MTDATARVFPRRRGELSDGRSIEECLEEFGPRAQALKDSRTREVMRVLDLEADVAAMRADAGRSVPQPKTRRHPVDRRKVFIAACKARGMSDYAIALGMDARKGFETEERWQRLTGLKLWREMWYARRQGFPKTQANARKFLRVVEPFVPHKQNSRRPATTASDQQAIVKPVQTARFEHISDQ